jgi:hypothetical protein
MQNLLRRWCHFRSELATGGVTQPNTPHIYFQSGRPYILLPFIYTILPDDLGRMLRRFIYTSTVGALPPRRYEQ